MMESRAMANTNQGASQSVSQSGLFRKIRNIFGTRGFWEELVYIPR